MSSFKEFIMINTILDVDYKNNIFEYPELTRLRGEPTTSSLMTLENEIKANAQSVMTTLGGGNNGHLGLVLDPTRYGRIPGTSVYNCPTLPTLVFAATATGPQIALQKEIYYENLRLFKETNAVERVLVQQIVSAVDAKYLKALQNSRTNKITGDIPAIMEHLLTNYGDVTKEELRSVCNTVEQLTFHPNEPIDVIFTEVDMLSDLSEIAKSPLSEAQKIDLAYVVIQKTQKFKSDLKSWNQKTTLHQTWENFKIHFRKAQKELRRTGDLTIEQSISHAELVDRITEGVQQAVQQQMQPDDTTILAANLANENNTQQQLDELQERYNELIMATTSEQQITDHQPYNNNHPPQYQNQYQQNNQQRYQNQFYRNQNQPTYNNRQYGGRSQNSRYAGRQPSFPRQQGVFQTSYCWTHGICGHASNRCRNKMRGHKNEATINNRMGGSNFRQTRFR